MLLLMCLLLLIQDQTLSQQNGWNSQKDIKGMEYAKEEANESNIGDQRDKCIEKELEDSSESAILGRDNLKNIPTQVFRDCLKFLERHFADRDLDFSNLTNMKEDSLGVLESGLKESGLKERTDVEESKGESALKGYYTDAEKIKLKDLVQLFPYNQSQDYGTKTLQDLFRLSRRRLNKANYYSPQWSKSVAYDSKRINQKGNTPIIMSSVLDNPTISFVTREPILKNENIKIKNTFRKNLRKTKAKIPISSLRESGQILHENIQNIENEITVIPVTQTFANQQKEEGIEKYDNVLKLPLSVICQEFHKYSGDSSKNNKGREGKTNSDNVIRLTDNSNAIINLSELCKVMKNLSKSQSENTFPYFTKRRAKVTTYSYLTEDPDYDYLNELGVTNWGGSANLSSNKSSAEATVILVCMTSIKPYIDTTTQEAKGTSTSTTGTTHLSTSAGTISTSSTIKASEPCSGTTTSTKMLSMTECTCECTKQTPLSVTTPNFETTNNGATKNNSIMSTTPGTSSQAPQKNESTWKRKFVALTTTSGWRSGKSKNFKLMPTSPDSTELLDFDWGDWDTSKEKNEKQGSLSHPNMTLILKDFVPHHLKRTTSLPDDDLKRYTLVIYKPHKSYSTPWSLQPASRNEVVIKNIRPIERKYESPELKTRSSKMRKMHSTTKLSCDYYENDDFGDDAEDVDFYWKPTTKSLRVSPLKIINCDKESQLEPYFKKSKPIWKMGHTKFPSRQTDYSLIKSKYISKYLSHDLGPAGILVPENSKSHLKSNTVKNDCLEKEIRLLDENESDEDFELEGRSTDTNLGEGICQHKNSEQTLVFDPKRNKKKVFWASMEPKNDTNVIIVYVVNQNATSLPNEIELKLQQNVDV